MTVPDSLAGRLTARTWLDEWSEPALRGGLQRAAPELATLPITLIPKLGAPLGVFCRGTAYLGDDLMVKAAWSREAAENLVGQARLILALDGLGLPLQIPVVRTTDPVLVIHRRLPGRELTSERARALDAFGRQRVGELIGNVLQRLHNPSTLALALAAGIELPAEREWCQADTGRLRRDLIPLLDDSRAQRLEPRLDWVDEQLEGATKAVFLHGDLHGWNLLFDDDLTRLEGVLDLESAACGDPAFDLRYLPSLGGTAELFYAILRVYQPPSLPRAWAWHFLTDLGDALWRTEQNVALEGGPLTRRVDDLLGRLEGAGT